MDRVLRTARGRGAHVVSRGAIHQFLPSFAGRDAIGRHTLAIQRALVAAGFESDIYAGESRRTDGASAKQYQSFKGGPSGRTWLLYQCSTGSPVGTWCAERSEPMIIDYHNITPAEMFAAWEPSVAAELTAGRHQLADSTYNAAELSSLGFPSPIVVPILLDGDDFAGAPDAKTLAMLQATKRGHDWLFVGRLAPNKAQHDVIRAFAAYRRIDPHARLHLVGGSSSHRYETVLADYISVLGLDDAVRFASSVSHDELLAHYAVADVFVCLSDHEGFCVPLLEAMHACLPIVAFSATAVPETIGLYDGDPAALLLASKDPETVACAADRIVTDARLRDALVASGRRRLQHFSIEQSTARLLTAIEAIVA
jgi:glycosyltransferase involved in cell wall biosynthesis